MHEEYIYIEDNQLSIARLNQFPGRPTIIFLHNSLGSIQLWRDFPEKLAEATACNVLVYDRQGYGKSSPFKSGDRTNNYLELEADVVNQLI